MIKTRVKMRIVLFLSWGMLLGDFAYGQGVVKRDALTNLDRGINAMKDGHYQAADLFFRDALSKLHKLPSQLAYYFGRNSYHLQKHKQAINWLNKYVELKGTAGQFYESATQYLALANEAFKSAREKEIDRTKKQLTIEGYFDCPTEYVLCPICSGTGVLITPGKLSVVYQTCPYSGLSGRLTCEEYNQYLNGKLKPKVP